MKYPSKQVAVSICNKVATIRFNNPKRLNGWSKVMLSEVKESMRLAGQDSEVGAAIVTGTGDYYCAGVDFGGGMSFMHPRSMKQMIEDGNREIFDAFIQFPKPLIAAVNGHAIGASVTSAVLCDRIMASKTATFFTPFHKLGIPPEGCSSVTFASKMGAANAERMLGKEGWKPTAEEALQAGLINSVHDSELLMKDAQSAAEELISSGYQRTRDAEYLMKVNAEESVKLAEAFLGTAFLNNQAEHFREKNKTQLSWTFKTLALTRPLWSRL
eukprot:TRINITY_DN341_c8_g1_i1.p1 TRINITY_DN341_c8_g1~~TRINITY_DN341_c8_g1_i1.p1  ORF type:complete len:294 (+),score=40.13 TRINITY_DN341_c8_g1_i1:71-883(+)